MQNQNTTQPAYIYVMFFGIFLSVVTFITTPNGEVEMFGFVWTFVGLMMISAMLMCVVGFVMGLIRMRGVRRLLRDRRAQ